MFLGWDKALHLIFFLLYLLQITKIEDIKKGKR